jgi:glutamyl-Q tRNA(Asp) synthetase
MEDVDQPRCVAGADQTILQQLAACGLLSDETPVYQSSRDNLYQRALGQLVAAGLAYPCGCTRQNIARALADSGQARERHGELIYPGTCRHGLQGRTARAWRLLTTKNESSRPLAHTGLSQSAIESTENSTPAFAFDEDNIAWRDRRLGCQSQIVSHEVGDFVLRRADGLWAYQLAVVVDDAAQGITDIVRGEDLADNTARQILLQRALGLSLPRYLHTPLVMGVNGEKLSKQNDAQALDTSQPLTALNQAAAMLGLQPQKGEIAAALEAWVKEWKEAVVSATKLPTGAVSLGQPSTQG